MLGAFNRAVVVKWLTTIVANRKQGLVAKTRITQIKREGKDTNTNFDRDRVHEQVSALHNGIILIKVGSAIKTKLKDKKLRYKDTLNSVQSVRELGIAPGGGACLAYVQDHCSEEVVGGDVAVSSQDSASVVVVVSVFWEELSSSHATSQPLARQLCHQ